MTDTDVITAPKSRARAGLSGMVLTELRALAGELGIKGTSGMRKGDLIAAIKERQGGADQLTLTADVPKSADEAKTVKAKAPRTTRATRTAKAPADADSVAPVRGDADRTSAATDNGTGQEPAVEARGSDSDRQEPGQKESGQKESGRNDGGKGETARADDQPSDGTQGEGRNNRNRNRNQQVQNNNQRNENQRGDNNQRNENQRGENQQGRNQSGGGQNGPRDDDEDGGRGGRRGRRFRERRRGRDRDSSPSGEPQISDDDVLQPVAGILDVLDNYAFVRTSGYLAGQNDVYVSMNLVRRYGLRRGDAVTGAVKVPKDGEQANQRQKFNPLARLDTVNGGDPDAARKRPEFNKLTPLYPNQRLRLETTPDRLDTRVIDLIMPIGKGQRALIVSPPKAGKTTILQDIANAITTNNPECHLMVVLVDERPEEVTDMQRSVKGEVIASTFDRPPSDHTSVAELAIERAKRLVEQGKDVVVLLDSITRLGRAYNNASPASGRILSGGVDSTALYPPKRFLGAARNIENGGSLTIIASALVETGSTGDTVIFEEFKGTGNAELKLDRKIAERRVFPAVDVNLSSTRKDELLLSPEEFAIVHKLRRVLSGLDSQQAIDLLISQLKKSKTNIEFLMQVQSNAPGAMKDD
ncbi:transcription termination factor Rho [Gordonia pseudamarae]|uniref:Transcription termination factor Rho n=2 Tax=Gordonia TaxID=2053 RepID=A0ABX6IHI5_9ACTN|nr:transcription termination factor Rho [Gordonia sp. (in: high G+C Gram-positive bacteria)]QHN25899.1 transcription termination factor Rho [Gordonia pseudamarae]QHN34829.1 transcription termination factor Rho [Gordonia pseudamarae]